MPEISVKDQVKRLVDLQTIDGQIHQIRTDLTEKPALIEGLKKEFETSKAHFNALTNKLKAIQLKRKELELDLKNNEDQIAKFNAQLFLIKTNKEYQAKLTEIASIQADKSIFEEKILISYDEADLVQADINKEKIVVAAQENRYLTQKKIIEDDIVLLEDRSKVLASQRKQFLVGIDEACLARYERILAHKDGLAIVPIKNNSCMGCHMNVPPQTINAIKTHDQLIICEICQRILYVEDDL